MTEHQRPAMRAQRELHIMLIPGRDLGPCPGRRHREMAHLAIGVAPVDENAVAGDADDLALAAVAIADPEGEPDQQHINPEEEGHRPRPDGEEDETGDETDCDEHRHQDGKACARQRPVRRQRGIEEHLSARRCGRVGLGRPSLHGSGLHGGEYSAARAIFTGDESAQPRYAVAMPDPAALATYALAVLVIELTPGPNMAWLAILSATEGRRAGLAATAGVALGLLAIGVAAALGLAALIAGSPVLYDLLRWAGVLFLLYLAIEGWRAAGESSPSRLQDTGALRHFTRGFLINALNPKAGLFFVAVLPEFIDPAQPIAPQAALLTLVSVAIATAIHLGIVALSGSAQAFLADEARSLIARRILAVLLALIAVWLFFSTAR